LIPSLTVTLLQCGIDPSGNTVTDGCKNLYKKFVLVYDDAKCWPRELAVPIFANKGTSDQQMVACRDTVHHLLSAKPAGSYLKQPYEIRDAILARKVSSNLDSLLPYMDV